MEYTSAQPRHTIDGGKEGGYGLCNEVERNLQWLWNPMRSNQTCINSNMEVIKTVIPLLLSRTAVSSTLLVPRLPGTTE